MKMSRQNLAFAILMPLFMFLAIVLINVGPGPNFLQMRMRGFLIGFSVGLPVSFVMLPFIRKLLQKSPKISYIKPSSEIVTQ